MDTVDAQVHRLLISSRPSTPHSFLLNRVFRVSAFFPLCVCEREWGGAGPYFSVSLSVTLFEENLIVTFSFILRSSDKLPELAGYVPSSAELGKAWEGEA